MSICLIFFFFGLTYSQILLYFALSFHQIVELIQLLICKGCRQLSSRLFFAHDALIRIPVTRIKMNVINTAASPAALPCLVCMCECDEMHKTRLPTFSMCVCRAGGGYPSAGPLCLDTTGKQ